MSRGVRVALCGREYDIRIGSGVEPGAALVAAGVRAALVITDSNVDALHGERCARRLASLGLSVERAVVPAGESSKDMGQAALLCRRAVQAGLDRSSAIVALGGGMVGDLAGFVAATYLRGIRLAQVPTSLLAMVDSSIGGKTAVNLPEGKNLVGAFHQPCEVCADLLTLRTLPDREYRSGLAEVVKHGVIRDAAYFEDLERNADGLRARDLTVLERVVARSCEIKAEVVRLDEREESLRAILNFGHTLGHGLEAAAGYGAMLHGEAVSLGMVCACALSARLRGFTPSEHGRLVNLLTRLGLPVSLDPWRASVPWPAVRACMTADKKTRGRVPKWVLVRRLGEVEYGCEAPETEVAKAFEAI